MELQEFLKTIDLPENLTVFDSICKAFSVINNPKYNNILCSVSGGSDSDIMIDLVHKVDVSNKVKYVWFDTGLEWQATKNHLQYLENKYSIIIEKEKAIKPIPTTCKVNGQPFLSKQVSENIEYLQKHKFKWEDKPFEDLVKEYCKEVPEGTIHARCIDGIYYKGCIGSLMWWCNCKGIDKDKSISDKETNNLFNINTHKWLKEFLMKNPPNFPISKKCCTYAKKNVSKQLEKNYDIDLQITGIRKSEGGVRSTAYKNCISLNVHKADSYRPLFWYSNQDKVDYEKAYNIIHSDCYKIYGFARTGCCCCPYAGKKLHYQLSKAKKYEPNLYKAVNYVFKDSYEYTMAYYKFQKQMNNKHKELF